MIGWMFEKCAHVSKLGEYNVFHEAGKNSFSGAAILIKDSISVITAHSHQEHQQKYRN